MISYEEAREREIEAQLEKAMKLQLREKTAKL